MYLALPALKLFRESLAKSVKYRIVEEEIESSVEARNDGLSTIRELGPPDLVHLIKQAKSGGRQV